MSRELQEKAKAHISRNEWEDAIICLEQAQKQTPQNMYVLGELAFCYSRAKRYQEAITLYEQLCQSQPEEAKWFYGLGYQFYDQQQYDEAILHFDKALNLDPAYIAVLYRKGVALSQKGYNQRGYAINTFEKCREAYLALPEGEEKERQNKFYGGACYQQGKLLLDGGFLERAKERLEEAAKFKPKDSDLYYSLGKCYVEMGAYDEAIQTLKTAQQLADKPSHYVSDRLAQAYVGLGELQTALSIYENIPPFVRDRWPYILRNMGALYCKLDRWRDAEAMLQQATQKDRRNHNGYYLLGTVYEHNGKWAQAVTAYRTAIKQRQKVYGKEFPEAETALEELLLAHPDAESQRKKKKQEVTKSTPDHPVARVKVYFEDRGFGFIEVPGQQEDLFFHISEVENGQDIRAGLPVTYTEGIGKNGKKAAVKVKVLK
jgi:tetratricopeptide (TPR) repeat protein